MEISPTEGPDSCGIDISILSVTLLICLCGLAGNGAVFCLLKHSIHSKAITVYIFHMAITDFACLLLTLTYILFFLVEDVSCPIIRLPHYLIFVSLPQLFAYVLGLYLLTAISFSRCTLCPLSCHSHRPQQQSKVVSAMLWATSTAVIPTLTSLLVSDNDKCFIVILIKLYVLNLFFFASAMVISSTYFFIKVRHSCQQQPLERLDVVMFLTVLFGLPSGIYTFLLLFGNIVSPTVFPLLISIHLSIKPFIYLLAGRCWRLRSVGSLQLYLQGLFREPEETTARSNDDTTDTVV